MAGQTVEDARMKKRADDGRAGGGEKKKAENINVGRDKEGFACVTIAGESFHLAPVNPPPPPVANTVFTVTSTLLTEELPTFANPSYELKAFLAAEDGPHVSLDWNDYTANAATHRTTTSTQIPAPVPISALSARILSFSPLSLLALSVASRAVPSTPPESAL
jgi:hypothetical protein